MTGQLALDFTPTVEVRGADADYTGSTCVDCGEPAHPATIADRPTCSGCLENHAHADDWFILHMNGSDSERGAAALARLIAAGQYDPDAE